MTSLKLYVTGNGSRSQLLVDGLVRFCREHLGEAYDLEVIDVLQHPGVAEDNKIIATPTLVRVVPPPALRIVGDLNDEAKLARTLDLPFDSAGGNGSR